MRISYTIIFDEKEKNKGQCIDVKAILFKIVVREKSEITHDDRLIISATDR